MRFRKSLRTRYLAFESLERRDVKAAYMFEEGLAVVGTKGNDYVEVSVPTTGQHAGRMLVNINGERASFELNGFGAVWIVTGPGDDRITVDPSAVNIRGPHTVYYAGGKGNDTITSAIDGYFYGEAGDDVINANGELLGEAGNDTLRGDGALSGGKGNDILVGAEGRNVLFGDAGNDIIYGNGGDDMIDGGAGNDEIHGGDGHDVIRGGAGNDSIFGDADYDEVFGEAGNDEVHGGAWADFLYGGKGNDSLFGDEGDDNILGEVGNDFLDGGTGDDTLLADAGKDQLFGDEGDDDLHGGKGIDLCYGGLGTDYLWGDEGNDSLQGDEGNDNLEGGLGIDKCFGGDGDDQLIGGREKDVLDGGTGNNLSDLNNGNALVSNCLEADLDAECYTGLEWQNENSFMALDVQNIGGTVQYTLRIVIDHPSIYSYTDDVVINGVNVGQMSIVGGVGSLEFSTDPNISPLGLGPGFPKVGAGVNVLVAGTSAVLQKAYVV